MDTSAIGANSAIAYRLARLNLDVVEDQGDAAISLLESAKEFAQQQSAGGGRVAPTTGVDVEA